MRIGSALAFALALSAVPGAASAEVKEYQIRRMLMLKTECGVSGLDISKITESSGVPGGGGGRYTDRFVAECGNVTHYPDGVEILCPDTEDEQDCRILTLKRDFPHLHLFKR